MLISVIIPTIAGREDFYAQCVSSYAPLAESGEAEIITERDHKSAGLAWQAGAEKASGDYLHFTCDDQIAAPGWHLPAIEAVEEGFVPAPRMYGPDGEPQYMPAWGQEHPDWTPVTRTAIPFCSRKQWECIGPLFTAHYYTDDFFTYRAISAGWQPRVRHGYDFRHLWAQHGRGAGMTENERLRHDEVLYLEALRRVEEGSWDAPWPEEGI